MPKYNVRFFLQVTVEAEDRESAEELAVEKVKSPLVDRENVEDVELEEP